MLEMWTWILYLTRFLGLLSFCHGAQQDGGSAYHFTSGCSAVVPFEVTKNIIFFQIHVQGSSRALWFNLDSGAGSSYMDTEVAKSLGLRTVGSGTVNGAGFGDVPVEYVDSVTFELPGLESGGHRINTTDFKSLNEQFGRAEDGLLGYDFLSRYVVVLDYAGQKMTVYDPSNFKYTGSGVALSVHFRRHWPSYHRMLFGQSRRPAQNWRRSVTKIYGNFRLRASTDHS
jgi:hypothetical protein